MYRNLKSELQPILLVMLLAGLVVGAVFADRLFVQQELNALEERATEDLRRIASDAASVLRDFVQLTRGVAAAMAADPNMSQANFQRLAQQLFREYPDARNIAAAPDLVIRYVYPLAGNEQALGLDYRTVPHQMMAVRRARDTGEAVVDGPIDLVQGGRGFVARVPVFIRTGDDEDAFWGLAAGVLDEEQLYRHAGLANPGHWLEVGIERVLTGDDLGEFFYGAETLRRTKTVSVTVPSSLFAWQFYARPVGGWQVAPARQWSFRLALLITILLIALPAFGMLRTQRHLSRALADLDVTLKAIPETMFEVDAEGHVLDLWADPEDLIVERTEKLKPGTPIAAILPAHAADQLMKAVRHAAAGHTVSGRQLTVSKAEGTRHFELSISSQPWPKDGAFVVLLRNTTELRDTEMRERMRHAVLEKVGQGAPLVDVLEFVAGQVTRQSPGLYCAIFAIEQRSGTLRFEAAPELSHDLVSGMLQVLLQGGGPVSDALTMKSRRVVENVSTSAECQPIWAASAEVGLAGALVEPVLGSQGEQLGGVVFFRAKSGSDWGAEEAVIAAAINLVSLAIERARVNDDLRLADLVYRSSSEAMLVTDADNRIIAVNPAFTTVTGYSPDEAIGQSPSMLQSGRHGEEFYREMWHALNTTGAWVGEIWNRRKNGEEFPEWLTINTIYNADGKVQSRIALFADISEKKKADELIWSQANYDTLTKLPNRRLFIDRLEQGLRKAGRDKSLLALLMVDLDRFKEVNDNFGHHFGDQLLIEAAHRIQSCVRSSDSVSRLGGDEFTVMMTDLRGSADVDRVTQKILQMLAEPFHIEDHPVYISGSIGITLFPDDADTPVDMLKNADQAMYESKRLGRNRYCWFSRAMQEAAQTRMQTAADLRVAIERQEFSVAYQPVVNMNTGEVLKVEALVRWTHPVRGSVSPAAFIPIAEETGLIDEIGFWVFSQAVRQARMWRERFGIDLQVSVNNSPVQFQEKYRLHTRWVEEVRSNGVPPEAVTMEITEGILMTEDSHTRAQLELFQRAGFAIAIDDFGTGYSSLSYLKKFDVDYLKIDRAFVMHLAPGSSDAALCQAIIVMAHTLGLKVIAEGVETQEQHALLKEMGCDFGQGYLYSRPVPAETIDGILEKQFGAP